MFCRKRIQGDNFSATSPSFALNCSEISGRQLNPRQTFSLNGSRKAQPRFADWNQTSSMNIDVFEDAGKQPEKSSLNFFLKPGLRLHSSHPQPKTLVNSFSALIQQLFIKKNGPYVLGFLPHKCQFWLLKKSVKILWQGLWSLPSTRNERKWITSKNGEIWKRRIRYFPSTPARISLKTRVFWFKTDTTAYKGVFQKVPFSMQTLSALTWRFQINSGLWRAF